MSSPAIRRGIRRHRPDIKMADGTFYRYVRAMKPGRIHVLVLPDCTAFVPVGFVDLLRKSVALAASVPGRPARAIDVTLVSAAGGREVIGAGGIRVKCDVRMTEVRKSE